MRGILRWAGVALVFLCSCGLVYGSSEDPFDDGRSDHTSPIDAGSEPSDGGVAHDGAVTDVAVRTRYCEKASPSFLCEDFEEVGIDPRWISSGAVAIEQGPLPFGRSYASTTSSRDASAIIKDSSLTVTLSHTSHLRLSWSMVKDTPSCSANIAGVRYELGEEIYIDQLRSYEDGSLEFQEFGTSGVGYEKHEKFDSSTMVGQWLRVAMDVDLRSGSSVANITLNDEPIPRLKNYPLAPQLSIATATPFAFLGIAFVVGPSGACKFRFDDVRVELL